jgi:hypothetical protein
VYVGLVVGCVTCTTLLAQPHLWGTPATLAVVGAATGMIMAVSLQLGVVMPLSLVLRACWQDLVAEVMAAAAAAAAGDEEDGQMLEGGSRGPGIRQQAGAVGGRGASGGGRGTGRGGGRVRGAGPAGTAGEEGGGEVSRRGSSGHQLWHQYGMP